jgi:guanine nucleotide-binding protein G(i) subunit alpha
MGNCFTGPKKVEDKITEDKKPITKSNEFRFLLLGSGESGKSTFFKQLKAIFGESIIGPEESMYRTTIYANVLNTMTLLTAYCLKENTIQDEDVKVRN